MIPIILKRPARTRIAALGLFAALFGPFAALAEARPMRIALTREASTGPLLVAVAAGHFKAEGLDPQLMFLASDESVSAAVASAKADIGLASLSAPFFRDAAAHGFKMIASRSSDKAGFPMDALLVSKKARAAGLSNERGLSNARIGVTSIDSGAYYALFSIASRFKLDPASIKTIPLRSSKLAVRALSRGEIDAVLLPFAAAVQSARAGYGSLLGLSDFVEWQQGVVFTTAKNIVERRHLIERFMRAYQRGTAEYGLNFLEYDDAGEFIPGPHYGEYLDLIARQVKLPPEMLTLTKTYCDRRANLDVADIEKQVRFWQATGRLDKGIAASDLLDLSFIGAETVSTQ